MDSADSVSAPLDLEQLGTLNEEVRSEHDHHVDRVDQALGDDHFGFAEEALRQRR